MCVGVCVGVCWLTKAPFISLNTTPLNTRGVFGSSGFSFSSLQPSCLQDSEAKCCWLLLPHIKTVSAYCETLHGYSFTDRVLKLAMKSLPLLLNREQEYHGTDHCLTGIWFWKVEEGFSGENTPREAANAWDHPIHRFTNTPATPNSIQTCRSARLRSQVKWATESTKTHYLWQNRQPCSFQKSSIHQVICCIGNSVNMLLIGNV